MIKEIEILERLTELTKGGGLAWGLTWVQGKVGFWQAEHKGCIFTLFAGSFRLDVLSPKIKGSPVPLIQGQILKDFTDLVNEFYGEKGVTREEILDVALECLEEKD